MLIGVDKVKALFFEWAQVLLAPVCSREVLAVGYSLPYINYQLLLRVLHIDYQPSIYCNVIKHHSNMETEDDGLIHTHNGI